MIFGCSGQHFGFQGENLSKNFFFFFEVNILISGCSAQHFSVFRQKLVKISVFQVKRRIAIIIKTTKRILIQYIRIDFDFG